jgi:hypothetical protein
MGLHAIRTRRQVERTAQVLQGFVQIQAVGTEPVSGMVYKWAALTEAKRCLSVQGHWLPIRGSKWLDTTSNRARGCSQPEAVDT